MDVTLWEETVLPAVPRWCRTDVGRHVASALVEYIADRHFAFVAQIEQACLLLLSAREGKTTAMDDEQSEVSSPPVASPTTAAAVMAMPNESRANGGGNDAAEDAGCQMGASMALHFLMAQVMFVDGTNKARECVNILHESRLDNPSWTPSSVDKDHDGTYFRKEPGSPSYSFRVSGFVPASLIHVLGVVLELDLFKEWFPMCYFSEELAMKTKFHRTARFCVRLSWPFNNRECFCEGYGVDDISHRRVVIKSHSPADDVPLFNGKLPPPAIGSNVRALMKLGGFVLESVAEKRTRVTMYINVDPQIKNVPPILVNFVTKNIFWVLLWQMGKAAERAALPTGPYAERRLQRKDMYDYIQGRLHEAGV